MEFTTQLTSVFGTGAKLPMVSTPSSGLVGYLEPGKKGKYKVNFALNGFCWDSRSLKFLERIEESEFLSEEEALDTIKSVIKLFIKKGKFLNEI